MHTINETATGVPAFLAKLWRLVEDPDTNHLIYWQSDGLSFIIQNQAQFARELLPQNYKHNNMASFIRQLNMYGFHKKASIDNGGLKFDKDEMEFSHPFFRRGNHYLLEHIKRKIATTKQQPPEDKAAIQPEIVNKVMSEVKVVRGRQDTLDSRFSAMKQENEALWREIAVLRQKHLKQQQIVNKLIQFLVTLVQPTTRGGAGMNAMNGVKRRFQLMINDVPDSAKVRKQSQDSGPVIHEFTEDLLDDYDYDAPIDSPTILSPNSSSVAQNGDFDEVSSPTNFRIERMTDLIDNTNADADANDEEIITSDDGTSYIINKQPKNFEWTKSDNATDSATNQIDAEPVQEYVVSRVNPATQSKTKVETKVPTTKPFVASKSQLPGTSLLNQQQVAKKRPQLLLKMNKPIRNDGKIIQSAAGPSKVVVSKRPATSTIATMPISQKAASKSYTNQSDFNNSDMPHDLFELPDDSVSPMLNGDMNAVSSSSNATLSDDYSKTLMPTSSKNLAMAKYNNKPDYKDIQLNTPDDVSKQLDTTQGELDSLKELLQADGDYSLDVNALFGIFGDLDVPFGLSMNPDFPMEKRDDAGASGSELMNYQPYNSLDLSEIIDPESALAGIEDKQNEITDEESFLNASDLNTPRIDKKTISFNTKH